MKDRLLTGRRERQLARLRVERRGLLVDLEPRLAGGGLSRVRGGRRLGHHDIDVLEISTNQTKIRKRAIWLTYARVVNRTVLEDGR